MRGHSSLLLGALLGLGGQAYLQGQALQDPNLVFFILAGQSRTAFTMQGAGARAIGTGGAFIAVADDATAVSYNPAGLAQLLKPEFSAVGRWLSRRQDFQRFSSPDVSYDDSSNTESRTSPEFFSFAIPWKHQGQNFVLQVSHQRIFDFSYKSDLIFNSRVGGNPRKNRQYVDQRGGVNVWSAALGAELSSRFLLGASINFWRGSWVFTSDSLAATSTGSPLTELSFAQNSAFRGVNWSLGTIWRSDYLNIGAVYRSAFKADYAFTNVLAFEDYSGGTPNTSETLASEVFQLQWPESLGIGLGLHPHPRWLLTADWTRVRWSGTTIRAGGTSYDGLNFFDLQRVTGTPDVSDLRGGAEWIAFLGDKVVIPLRAGIFREPQPLKDRRTGEQRVFKGWTLGVGVKAGAFTLDVAYKKSDAMRNVARLQLTSSGTASYITGQEDLDEQRVFLSLIWQLDPLTVRRALRWVFVGN
ncbi:MAG: hypothetical protein HY823_00450 [Acidobacteria bacterium]|nr:hypothetical protein [Acidobacteriota bacterium]